MPIKGKPFVSLCSFENRTKTDGQDFIKLVAANLLLNSVAPNLPMFVPGIHELHLGNSVCRCIGIEHLRRSVVAESVTVA
jgi:hypothetical protein